MNLEMKGKHHSGKDDAYNAAQILIKLTQKGYVDYKDLAR